MAKRRGRNSRGVAKDKDVKEKDKEAAGSKKAEKEDGDGRRRRGRRDRKDRSGKEKAGIDLDKVARQLDFYFSDANLRRDRYMKKTIDEGDGAIELEALLNFNRIKALGVTEVSQLLEAVQCSGMLELAEEDTKVRRDFQKHPMGSYDPVSRTLYVEGLPLTVGIDDLTKFFSEHGQVKLVELPQHRETREPRGFGFVEFASQQEAEAALSACNGLWPQSWPPRYDAKTLRLMRKAEWHQQCREYKLLQAKSRGPSFEGKPKDLPLPPPETPGPKTETASATASGTEKPKASRTPGCLVKLTNFSASDDLICTLAIRQFAEHAVVVEYCDYAPAEATAHLRLKCPEDTSILLEDMKLTGRMLGCHQPTAEVLGPQEEEQYWLTVMERQKHRGPKSDGANIVKEAKQTAKRREAENVTTRIRRWRLVSNPPGTFRSGFTDTVGGSQHFTASGFGKTKKAKRTPKVIPPRKREVNEEAAAKARKAEKVPLVPPPSPFSLPGTTRKRKKGSQVPPPSPAHPSLPPPSPCLDESMSPDSASAGSPPAAPAVGEAPPAPEAPEEVEFDPDEIVSMMEGF